MFVFGMIYKILSISLLIKLLIKTPCAIEKQKKRKLLGLQYNLIIRSQHCCLYFIFPFYRKRLVSRQSGRQGDGGREERFLVSLLSVSISLEIQEERQMEETSFNSVIQSLSSIGRSFT